MLGKAYMAGGEFFSEYILRYVHILKSSVDSINTDLTTYRSADAEVRGYGYLNEDELNATKASFQSTIRSLSKIRDNYQRRGRNEDNQDTAAKYRQYAKKFQWQIEGQQEGLKEAEKELAKLQDFNDNVSRLFSSSIDELNDVGTNLNSLASSNFGNYGIHLSHGLRSNFNRITKIDNYKKAYDMDYDLSKEVIEFSKTFNRYAKKQGWSKKQASYMFAMYIASLGGYNGAEWRFAGGTFKTPTEAMNPLKKMGYSETFLNSFQYSLYYNHKRNGKNVNNDFVHIMGALSVILHPYKKGKKIDISLPYPFKEGVFNKEGLFNSTKHDVTLITHNKSSLMYDARDQVSNFTMKTGTSGLGTLGVFTCVVSPVSGGMVSFGLGGEMITWNSLRNDDNVKADATYRGDIASGYEGVSISDTAADTDTLNLANDVQRGASLTDSINSYSETLNKDGNRVTELFRNIGKGNVKDGKNEFYNQVFEHPTDGGSIYLEYTDKTSSQTHKASQKYWKYTKDLEDNK